jgi:hypothetical protein
MAEQPVNNPERILRILDSYLEKETRIVLFGRAALALGFGKLGSEFGKTGLASIKWTPIQAALMSFSFWLFSKATGEI